MIELLISFIFLLFLEIILGIDNILFISIVTDKLPKQYQKLVRNIGLSLSLVFRLILLFFIGFLLQFDDPLFVIVELEISIKDLILIVGGAFLIYKSTSSIHDEFDSVEEEGDNKNRKSKYAVLFAILQIVFIDLVFSLDSLIVAIGITKHLYIISAAIIISVMFMIAFAGVISNFISKYPTLKMLALTFVMIIGVFLILEGVSVHVNKGYLYFAMAFSLVVEGLNSMIRNKRRRSRTNRHIGTKNER